MSAYYPPIETIPKFNTILFREAQTSLSSQYLEFPNAQGNETFNNHNLIFKNSAIIDQTGSDVNIMKAITMNANSNLLQSGTGILSQNGTGVNALKDTAISGVLTCNSTVDINADMTTRNITQDANNSLLQSGTGILSQSGSGINQMKSITMNADADINFSSTGIINQTTGAVINVMNQITLNAGKNLVQSGASRINQLSATGTNLFTGITMNANANISQSGNGFITQSGLGTYILKDTYGTRMYTTNTMTGIVTTIANQTNVTTENEVLGFTVYIPEYCDNKVDFIMPFSSNISGQGNTNPPSNLVFTLNGASSIIKIYKNNILWTTLPTSLGTITKRYSFTGTAPVSGTANQYINYISASFTPEYIPTASTYTIYYYFSFTVTTGANSSVANKRIQINTTNAGFIGTNLSALDPNGTVYNSPAINTSIVNDIEGINIRGYNITAENIDCNNISSAIQIQEPVKIIGTIAGNDLIASNNTNTLVYTFTVSAFNTSMINLNIPISGFFSAKGINASPGVNDYFFIDNELTDYDFNIYKNGTFWLSIPAEQDGTSGLTKNYNSSLIPPSGGQATVIAEIFYSNFMCDFLPDNNSSTQTYEVFFNANITTTLRNNITSMTKTLLSSGCKVNIFTAINAKTSVGGIFPTVGTPFTVASYNSEPFVNTTVGTVYTNNLVSNSLHTSGMGVYLYGGSYNISNNVFSINQMLILSASSSNLQFSGDLTANAVGGSINVVGSSLLTSFNNSINQFVIPYGYGIIGYEDANFIGNVIINVGNFSSKNMNYVYGTGAYTLSSARIFFNGRQID